LLGEEGSRAVAVMLGSSQELKRKIALVEKGSYAERMYAARMKTTNAQYESTKNKLKMLKIELGETAGVLGQNKTALGDIQQIIDGIRKAVGEHPDLARYGVNLTAISGALVGIGTAARLMWWATGPIFTGLTSSIGAIVAKAGGLAVLARGFGLVLSRATPLLAALGLIVTALEDIHEYGISPTDPRRLAYETARLKDREIQMDNLLTSLGVNIKEYNRTIGGIPDITGSVGGIIGRPYPTSAPPGRFTYQMPTIPTMQPVPVQGNRVMQIAEGLIESFTPKTPADTASDKTTENHYYGDIQITVEESETPVQTAKEIQKILEDSSRTNLNFIDMSER